MGFFLEPFQNALEVVEEAKKDFETAFKIVGVMESYEKLLQIYEKWFGEA